VMTRRAICRHRFEQIRLTGEHPLARRGGQTVVFLAEGSLLRCRPYGGRVVALGRRDCLVLEQADPADWRIEVDGAATVFLVTIGR